MYSDSYKKIKISLNSKEKSLLKKTEKNDLKKANDKKKQNAFFNFCFVSNLNFLFLYFFYFLEELFLLNLWKF